MSTRFIAFTGARGRIGDDFALSMEANLAPASSSEAPRGLQRQNSMENLSLAMEAIMIDDTQAGDYNENAQVWDATQAETQAGGYNDDPSPIETIIFKEFMKKSAAQLEDWATVAMSWIVQLPTEDDDRMAKHIKDDMTDDIEDFASELAVSASKLLGDSNANTFSQQKSLTIATQQLLASMTMKYRQKKYYFEGFIKRCKENTDKSTEAGSETDDGSENPKPIKRRRRKTWQDVVLETSKSSESQKKAKIGTENQ